MSKVTVSLALRGNRRISASMRDRVLTVATELGYTPNPLVSALMVSLRTHRSAGRAFSLCFLTAHPTREGWQEVPVFRAYHEGVRARAEALGYGLETHWVGDYRENPARLTRVLEARGIPGVIIAPLPSGAPPIQLDWSRFATVALGHTFKQVPTHRVTNNQLHTISDALGACRAAGHRRIGLAAPRKSDDRVDNSWLAGFLAFQAIHPEVKKLRPLIAHPFTEEAFLAWFRLLRPEVVVTPEREVLVWLRRHNLRVPESVGYVHLDWHPAHGDLAGINQNPDHIGQAAAELLVEQINQNHRGSPDIPKTVLIEGVWRPGPTLPVLAPARASRPPGARSVF